MNIRLIDLRNFNHPQIRTLCDIHGFNYDILCGYKDSGYAKVWIDGDSNDHKIFAYTNKKSSDFIATIHLRDYFNSIPSLELAKQPRKLDLDSILDKIAKWGKDSLSKEEIEFLNGFKNL